MWLLCLARINKPPTPSHTQKKRSNNINSNYRWSEWERERNRKWKQLTKSINLRKNRTPNTVFLFHSHSLSLSFSLKKNPKSTDKNISSVLFTFSLLKRFLSFRNCTRTGGTCLVSLQFLSGSVEFGSWSVQNGPVQSGTRRLTIRSGTGMDGFRTGNRTWRWPTLIRLWLYSYLFLLIMINYDYVVDAEGVWQLGLGETESEYPERSNEQDCMYYLRTGFCGYGARCRYNHPRDRNAVILTDLTWIEF